MLNAYECLAVAICVSARAALISNGSNCVHKNASRGSEQMLFSFPSRESIAAASRPYRHFFQSPMWRAKKKKGNEKVDHLSARPEPHHEKIAARRLQSKVHIVHGIFY